MTGQRDIATPLRRYPLGRAGSSRERLLLSAALSSFGVLGFSLTAPILPDLRTALGISEGAVGWVQGAVALPGIVVSVVIGYLADRYGRRRAALSSLLLFGTMGVACAFADSFWLLVTFRLIQGLGMSGILGFGIILVGDYFEGPHRARAMGINQTAMLVTAMFGPVMGGLLATGDHPFRPFFLFLGAYPLAIWALRMPEMGAGARHSPAGHVRATVDLLRRSGTLADYLGVLGVTLVVISVGIGLALTVVPLFLESVFAVPVAQRGLIVACYQAGSAVTALRSQWVASRLGTPAALTLGIVGLGAGMGVIAAANGPLMVAGGLVLAGLGFGLFIPLPQTWVSGVGTAAHRGLAVGIWLSANRLAQTVAPPVGSAISHRAGPRVVLWLGAAAAAATATAWQWLRAWFNRSPERRRRPPPA